MNTHAEIGIEETIRLREYHDVEAVFPNFAGLGQRQQLYRLARLEPDHVEEATNVVVDAHVQFIVNSLLPNKSPANALEATNIVVGDDDSQPSSSDTSLGNQQGSFSATTVSDTTNSFTRSITLGESQLNQINIAEAGLYDANNSVLLNHGLIGPRLKTDLKTFTIDIQITYNQI